MIMCARARLFNVRKCYLFKFKYYSTSLVSHRGLFALWSHSWSSKRFTKNSPEDSRNPLTKERLSRVVQKSSLVPLCDIDDAWQHLEVNFILFLLLLKATDMYSYFIVASFGAYAFSVISLHIQFIAFVSLLILHRSNGTKTLQRHEWVKLVADISKQERKEAKSCLWRQRAEKNRGWTL